MTNTQTFKEIIDRIKTAVFDREMELADALNDPATTEERIELELTSGIDELNWVLNEIDRILSTYEIGAN